MSACTQIIETEQQQVYPLYTRYYYNLNACTQISEIEHQQVYSCTFVVAII